MLCWPGGFVLLRLSSSKLGFPDEAVPAQSCNAKRTGGKTRLKSALSCFWLSSGTMTKTRWAITMARNG